MESLTMGWFRDPPPQTSTEQSRRLESRALGYILLAAVLLWGSALVWMMLDPLN
jgi:hypothetical protein